RSQGLATRGGVGCEGHSCLGPPGVQDADVARRCGFLDELALLAADAAADAGSLRLGVSDEVELGHVVDGHFLEAGRVQSARERGLAVADLDSWRAVLEP